MSDNYSPSISDQAIKDATGKTWKQWFEILREEKAEGITHKEIAAWLQKNYEVPGWWAQTITVEYERLIGRREAGQSAGGHYQVSASKTLPGTKDQILGLWQKIVEGMNHFDNVIFSDKPAVSKTDKWRYWRVTLSDGSKVAVSIGNKGDKKSLLTINHEKLQDQVAAKQWKVYWKSFLGNLKQ